MGSFGIYAIVVTFVFVIYYVVMICMDLFGPKGEKKESVEVIHAGTPVDNADGTPAVSPIRISETGEGKYQIERPGEEEPEKYGHETEEASSNKKGDGMETSQLDKKPLTAEDIAASDIEELAMQAKAKADSIRQNFNNVSPDIQGAVYVDEFVEDYVAAYLKGKSEDEQAEQLSF